jgi:hypothetical protein
MRRTVSGSVCAHTCTDVRVCRTQLGFLTKFVIERQYAQVREVRMPRKCGRSMYSPRIFWDPSLDGPNGLLLRAYYYLLLSPFDKRDSLSFCSRVRESKRGRAELAMGPKRRGIFHYNVASPWQLLPESPLFLPPSLPPSRPRAPTFSLPPPPPRPTAITHTRTLPVSPTHADIHRRPFLYRYLLLSHNILSAAAACFSLSHSLYLFRRALTVAANSNLSRTIS